MLEARIAQLEDKLRKRDGHRREAGRRRRRLGRQHGAGQGPEVRPVGAYQIVGSAEADPSENKLSNESPVGSALLGHKRGDVVTVSVPRGPSRKLKITKIEAA